MAHLLSIILISLITFIYISHRQSIIDAIPENDFLIARHIYCLYYHLLAQFQTFNWQTSILIDTKSGHLFSWSKTGSNYRNNKDLNKIETDYRDNKDLNQVETNYGDNKDNINIEINYGDNKDNVEVEIDYGNNKESIFLEAAAYHIPSLPCTRLTDVSDPGNDISSIAKFDIKRLSPPANPIAVGPSLMTSAANWKCGSTQDICTRMPEVSRICQRIYARFGLKAKP